MAGSVPSAEAGRTGAARRSRRAPRAVAGACTEPHSLLARLHHHHGSDMPLWLFGYASLIWRPEIEFVEHVPATVHGWHRTLRMRSVEHRGSPERPGLVFALMGGGSCRGMAYRLPPGDPLPLLRKLWVREMPNRVYEPRWLPARTPHGIVPALAFTLHRHSPACTGRLDDAHVLEIFRHARGGFGRTVDYVVQTAGALRAHGIVDSEVERLVRLARRHGLVGSTDGGSSASDTARDARDAHDADDAMTRTAPPRAALARVDGR